MLGTNTFVSDFFAGVFSVFQQFFNVLYFISFMFYNVQCFVSKAEFKEQFIISESLGKILIAFSYAYYYTDYYTIIRKNYYSLFSMVI